MKVIYLLVLFFSVNLFASQCENMIKGFINHQNENKTILEIEYLKKNNLDVGCIGSFKDGGYVVVSNTSSSTPIVSYSLNATFEKLPKDVKDMITNDLYVLKQNEIDYIHPTRTYLLNLKEPLPKKLYKITSSSLPLTSTWDQNGFYKKFMPKISDKNTLVGCVNVALGQIMKYHNHPLKGNGIVSHDFNGSTYTAHLNRVYNWENMPDSLSATSEDFQIDEVAMLLYDLAIANKTEFGLDGSGAYLYIQTLIENFGYSKNIKNMDASDKSLFFQTIKDEINAQRPMYLSIPSASTGNTGHAGVIDDYKDDELGRFMHVNFGWGGYADNYINIDTNPYVQGLNLTSSKQEIYYDIKPCSEQNNDCYINIESNDLKEDTNNGYKLSGNLYEQNDEDIFELYLNGNTTFYLKSDYFSSADFYVNLFDNNNNLIASFSQNSSIDLPANKYNIKVSKTNLNSASFYPYSDSYTNNYLINIETSTLTEEQKKTIDEANIKAPEFFDNLDYQVLIKGNSKKLVINAATINDETSFFTIASDNNVVNTEINGNILTINALNKGFANITIKAFSNAKENNINIPVVVIDQNITIGKKAIISDKFIEENQSKIFEYDVLLDGTCSIIGDRGYNNTSGFYISVNNSVMTENSIYQNFDKGIYKIKASLQNIDSGYYYSVNDNPDFSIYIDCNNIESTPEYLTTAFGITDYTLNKLNKKTINKDWNLVTLPSNEKISINKLIENYPQISIIWLYRNNIWHAYSSDLDTMNKIKTNNIPTISYIESHEAFWLNSTDVFELKSYGDSYISNFTDINDNWTLVGNKKEILPIEVFEKNPDINIVWQYNNTWEAYSINNSTNLEIENNYKLIEKIDQGNGLWIQK